MKKKKFWKNTVQALIPMPLLWVKLSLIVSKSPFGWQFAARRAKSV
jgi:hypothetical protein